MRITWFILLVFVCLGCDNSPQHVDRPYILSHQESEEPTEESLEAIKG
jgi:hypothetical protein